MIQFEVNNYNTAGKLNETQWGALITFVVLYYAL